MKKKVPNLIRIETNFEPIVSERILLRRYNRIIDEGYSFPIYDFYTYCALLIRHTDLKELPEIMKTGNKIKPEIKFELINCQISNDEKVSEKDLVFHLAVRRKMVEERKRIIKKEITRTNLNGKELQVIGPKNSIFYRALLSLTREFRDITLMDWFIPIVLTYERLIHIFIKHVEETKFGRGQFKHRTFFDYLPEEIWILLKTIIKLEKQSIQDHFLENRVNYDLKKLTMVKDYRRNFNNPIIFGGDKFVLRIDKNGFIQQFHQI